MVGQGISPLGSAETAGGVAVGGAAAILRRGADDPALGVAVGGAVTRAVEGRHRAPLRVAERGAAAAGGPGADDPPLSVAVGGGAAAVIRRRRGDPPLGVAVGGGRAVGGGGADYAPARIADGLRLGTDGDARREQRERQDNIQVFHRLDPPVFGSRFAARCRRKRLHIKIYPRGRSPSNPLRDCMPYYFIWDKLLINSGIGSFIALFFFDSPISMPITTIAIPQITPMASLALSKPGIRPTPIVQNIIDTRHPGPMKRISCFLYIFFSICCSTR